jgi:nucleoside-diphosphate-sugar epimerase
VLEGPISRSIAPLAESDGANPGRVGVIGASSLVGTCLLPMLVQDGWQVTAFTRQAGGPLNDAVAWRQLPAAACPSSRPPLPAAERATPYWICVAPIWVLAEHFSLFESCGVRRLLVLSSTSRFTKDDSSDVQEQAIAQRLADAEAQAQAWASSRGVEWVILRPTLIYGLGRDKNLCEIARFIRRFGFFPLLGAAQGLRQPIHAQDVASACLTALRAPAAANRAYNISGASTLAYKQMAAQVFVTLGRPVRLLQVPLWAFGLALAVLRCLPRYRHWSAAMAERMNRDLVFDHGDATRDFSFAPRVFALSREDLGQ